MTAPTRDDDRACDRCGASLGPGSPLRKYCDACRPLVQREQIAAWKVAHPDESRRYWRDYQRRQTTPPTWVTVVDGAYRQTCQRCGVDLSPGNLKRKYCDACRGIVQREQARAWHRRQYAANRDGGEDEDHGDEAG